MIYSRAISIIRFINETVIHSQTNVTANKQYIASERTIVNKYYTVCFKTFMIWQRVNYLKKYFYFKQKTCFVTAKYLYALVEAVFKIKLILTALYTYHCRDLVCRIR